MPKYSIRLRFHCNEISGSPVSIHLISGICVDQKMVTRVFSASQREQREHLARKGLFSHCHPNERAFTFSFNTY